MGLIVMECSFWRLAMCLDFTVIALVVDFLVIIGVQCVFATLSAIYC